MGAPAMEEDTVTMMDQEMKQQELIATYTALIQQYLNDVLCLDNAIFFAERLVATCGKTPDSLHLLAMCHYRNGSPQAAKAVLEDAKPSTPATQYLMAKCCLDMEQYGRAEEVILQQCRAEYRQLRASDVSTVGGDSTSAATTAHANMDDWILSTTPCPVPNGAAGLNLLGTICRRSNRKTRAMQYYRMSLKLDPFMWTSYEALCEMGATDLDPTTIFGVRPALLEQTHNDSILSKGPKPLQERFLTPSFSISQTPMEVKPLQPMDVGTPMTSGSFPMPRASLFQSTGQKATTRTQTNHVQFQTPNLTPIPMNETTDIAATSFVDSANPRVIRRARDVASRLYYQASPETVTPPPRVRSLRGLASTSKTRLSFSVKETPVSDTPVRRGGGGGSMINGNDGPPGKPHTLFHTSENKALNNTSTFEEEEVLEPSDEKDAVEVMGEESVQEILNLLCVLGAAWWQLCQYRCREALQLLQSLPHNQHNTGWVLHQEGRAYFEMSDYQNAQRCLELMQMVEPHRMKGLDLLSTVLWQLKKEVELAHLAQRVVDFDRLCPESWCVVGNCFSLQKEHETALVFFSRSLQLDPRFTYTHTLSGYEYMANEDFDKAVACFRNAIRSDDRHYNAWYGLGAIYYRQEKYDLAEYHFHRAVTINPQSSVLRCNLGMAQHANGRAFQALDTLQEAFRLDPRNPQARYQRATIYVSMNRPEEALLELEKVRDAAPREATIHFAMGRVLKRLGRPEQAMRCFLTALDLDPKDNQLIKSAMDKLDEPDVDEEMAAF